MELPHSRAGFQSCSQTQSRGISRRDFLAGAAGIVAAPSLMLDCAEAQVVIDASERQRIEAAMPSKPVVMPRKHRKLLIFDLNVGYGGHSSISTANLAFTLMGEKTGAFETVLSKDPSVFRPENLKQFDAVFLNNTVGNLFEDPALRQSLIEFIYSGGGLFGVHGTSVAFTRWPGAYEDWPEFGIMLGARGANHRDSDERIFIKLDDPGHPLNRPFDGKGFEFRDEFFRFHEPYSRHRVRVLLSIDIEKTDANQGPARGDCFREDNDYALAWVRQYGRGRVFYSTIAHNPYVFWDPKILQFYLAAAQFVLGDLPSPTTPSGKLTSAVRAQEQLGWRLGLTPVSSGSFTLFEAIDKTAELGLLYIGSSNLQKVSSELPKNFDGQLSPDELRQIRLKLDSAGIRMLTYYIHHLPSNETDCRNVFEFGRKMGIETFVAEPPQDAMDTIERLCDEYDINLAIPNEPRFIGDKTSPQYGHPEEVLKVCNGRSKRIGFCGNIDSWMRAGINPIEIIQTLGERLAILEIYAQDKPAGSDYGKIGTILKEIHHLGLKPTMFGIEYPHEGSGSIPAITQSIEFFNKMSVQLAKQGEL